MWLGDEAECLPWLIARFTGSNVEGELPVETKRFIDRHIVSVEQLDVLLLLHGEPARDWSATEINAQLRSQESSIAKWLAVLESMRLVRQAAARYRYSPDSPEVEQHVAALVAAYRERRIRVIEYIFSKSNENLLSFARAFDLRRRP